MSDYVVYATEVEVVFRKYFVVADSPEEARRMVGEGEADEFVDTHTTLEERDVTSVFDTDTQQVVWPVRG